MGFFDKVQSSLPQALPFSQTPYSLPQPSFAPQGPSAIACNIYKLKVYIHCEGCKEKVKKVIRKVEGVYRVDIDSDRNKVIVHCGKHVRSETLIKRLEKKGKKASIWGDETQFGIQYLPMERNQEIYPSNFDQKSTNPYYQMTQPNSNYSSGPSTNNRMNYFNDYNSNGCAIM